MAAGQLGLFDGLWWPAAAPAPVAGYEQDYSPSHPQANRYVLHEGRRLRYYLRRGRRRTIGLQVGSDGLVVSAPRWALVSDISDVVVQRAAWVVEKLREIRARDEAHLRQRIDWNDGVEIPYLGNKIRVCLDSGVRTEGLVAGEAGQELRLRLPQEAVAQQIREKVQTWLMARARVHFTERLQQFAPMLGVQWQRLRLSQARTRWGSANALGTICLNWRLIHHAPTVIDYVVVHELSHLRVMNHSPAFWDTVASVIPDYRLSRDILKKDLLPPW